MIKRLFQIGIVSLFILIAAFFWSGKKFSDLASVDLYAKQAETATTTPEIEVPKIIHIQTPSPVKAVYMSSWVAGAPKIRQRIIDLADNTEINAVVIDVKDSTGVVSFKMSDPVLTAVNPFEDRISDVPGLIKQLHSKNIYVIARIAVFEDPHLAKVRPDLAVRRRSTGGTWKDRKGLAWSDMGSKEVWDYNIAVAKGAYEAGFDELNFDYIRFPSDGDMTDIMYPSLEGKQYSKPEELRKFFHYLNLNLKDIPDASAGAGGIPMSADLFGMTTTNYDDLNIGQVLEYALPYFDYLAPMVYPSHYPPTFHGYKKPAEVPYELIKYVMGEGVMRAINASSSPNKLRPWLQDFDLGAVYTKEMVRAQIQATYDVGLSSWMLWDPSNHYTPAALEKN
jgi:hypothetical protein